ncbi:MAG: hypothetical protein H0W72_10500 [Planctomycetes bacterium]|nr:hypothetical protein [Planctomycetota bacterium]
MIDPRVKNVGGVAAALILMIGWWLWFRAPAVQTQRVFVRLSAAAEKGDPGGVLGCIHRDYDFAKHWPQFFTSDAAEGQRAEALRLLWMLFTIQRENPFVITWRIDDLDVSAGDPVVVHATLSIATRSGQTPFGLGQRLERHRFVLQRKGGFLTAAYAIVGHDLIGLDRPAEVDQAGE